MKITVDDLVSKIISTCVKTKYCTDCVCYCKDTGICVFGEEPKYWEHADVIRAIEKVVVKEVE